MNNVSVRLKIQRACLSSYRSIVKKQKDRIAELEAELDKWKRSQGGDGADNAETDTAQEN